MSAQPPEPGVVATWTAFAIGAVGFTAAVMSKALGGITDTQRLLRKIRKDREDARVVDMTEDIAHLRSRVDDLIRESDRIWRLIHAHHPWDYKVAARLRELDPESALDPPPPLMPLSQAAQEVKTAIVASEAVQAIDAIEAKAKAAPATPPRGIPVQREDDQIGHRP